MAAPTGSSQGQGRAPAGEQGQRVGVDGVDQLLCQAVEVLHIDVGGYVRATPRPYSLCVAGSGFLRRHHRPSRPPARGDQVRSEEALHRLDHRGRHFAEHSEPAAAVEAAPR